MYYTYQVLATVRIKLCENFLSCMVTKGNKPEYEAMMLSFLSCTAILYQQPATPHHWWWWWLWWQDCIIDISHTPMSPASGELLCYVCLCSWEFGVWQLKYSLCSPSRHLSTHIQFALCGHRIMRQYLSICIHIIIIPHYQQTPFFAAVVKVEH